LLLDDEDVLDVDDDESLELSELLLMRSINCLATDSDEDADELLPDDLSFD
jgi:hypothetical protein